MSQKIVPSVGIFPVSRTTALGSILWAVCAAQLLAQTPPDTPDTPSLTPYQTALLNFKTGHYDMARSAIETAEKQKPGDITTEILKARILTELGDFAGAQKVLEGINGQPGLTPDLRDAQTLVFGDLCLRRRSFDEAAKFYESLLSRKPDDSDLILKIVYTRVAASDLVMAAKYASELKPFDSASDPLDPKHPGNPSYYFAKAALAQATGNGGESDEDIQTARTLYGITVTNRYLKTYFELFAPRDKDPVKTPAATNAAPSAPTM